MCNFCQEHRSIARFIGYALCAADEALKDANWMPTEPEHKERTVIWEKDCYFLSKFKRVIMF